MEKILILGSMHDFEALTQSCINEGYYTVVADSYLDGPAKKIAHKSYNIDVFDLESMKEMCIKEQITGIVTGFSDVLMEAYVPLCKALGLRCYLSEGQLSIIRNKVIMQEVLSTKGIPTMPSIEIDRGFKEEDIEKIGFPAVIKPIDGYGSKGIYCVSSIEELRTYFNQVVSCSKEQKVLLQKYCFGKEYNCLVWVYKGKGHIIYICNREKFELSSNEIPLVYKFVYPATIFNELREKVSKTMNQLIEAYNIQEGPLAFQMFYEESKVIINEATLRLLGNGDHRSAFYAGNLKVEQLLVDYALGKTNPDIENRLSRFDPAYKPIIVQLQLYAREGTIVEIRGIEAIRKLDEVCHIECYYKIGDTIKNSGVSRQTVGMIFFKCESYEEIQAKCEALNQRIQIIDNRGEDLIYKLGSKLYTYV